MKFTKSQTCSTEQRPNGEKYQSEVPRMPLQLEQKEVIGSIPAQCNQITLLYYFVLLYEPI